MRLPVDECTGALSSLPSDGMYPGPAAMAPPLDGFRIQKHAQCEVDEVLPLSGAATVWVLRHHLPAVRTLQLLLRERPEIATGGLVTSSANSAAASASTAPPKTSPERSWRSLTGAKRLRTGVSFGTGVWAGPPRPLAAHDALWLATK
eukprot:1003819-Prymnesium_polylepis.1